MALRDRLKDEEGRSAALEAEVASGKEELQRSEGLRGEAEAMVVRLRAELQVAQERLAEVRGEADWGCAGGWGRRLPSNCDSHGCTGVKTRNSQI